MKNYFLIIFSAFVIQGCANVHVTPPDERKIDKSQIFNMSYDKTWNRAVDWFAENNVAIEKIEKSSGLLSAKYLLTASEKHIDCGKIDTAGFIGEPVIKRHVAINITVREIDSSSTKVNVNSFGEFQLTGKDAWDARIITTEGRCISTGDIETSILNFVGKK